MATCLESSVCNFDDGEDNHNDHGFVKLEEISDTNCPQDQT